MRDNCVDFYVIICFNNPAFKLQFVIGVCVGFPLLLIRSNYGPMLHRFPHNIGSSLFTYLLTYLLTYFFLSFFFCFFLLWGGTRSLHMPALRPASQAGPMRNPREVTSVVLRHTIRLT